MGSDRLCITCPVLSSHGNPRYVERPNVCEHCRARLNELLAEILGLVAQTGDKVQPERTSGPKVSGSRELPSPVNLTALGISVPPYERGPRRKWMLSPQAEPDDQRGITPPIVTLDHWTTDWISVRERAEHQPDLYLSEIILWLRNRLDWACNEHPAVDEFAADIKDMVHKLRGIVRDRDRGESAGRCPERLRDDSRCNTPLTVDPYVDLITCSRTGTSWHRRDAGWMKLRALQADWEESEEAA